MSTSATRLRVIGLYKELQRLGRDYPDPSSVPRIRLPHSLSSKQAFLTEFTGTITKAGCAGCSKVRLWLLSKRWSEVHTMRGNRQQTSQNRGRDQPSNQTGGIHKTRSGFSLNRTLLARLAEYGGTETLALYSLRKYRHLKVSFANHRVLRPNSPFAAPIPADVQ